MEMARERERRMDGWMDGCFAQAQDAGGGPPRPGGGGGRGRERERGERERGVGIGRGALKEIAPSPPLALRARGERVVLTKVPCYISFPPAAGCWLLAAGCCVLSPPPFPLGLPTATDLPPPHPCRYPTAEYPPPPRPALVEKIENRRNPRENHFSFSQQHNQSYES